MAACFMGLWLIVPAILEYGRKQCHVTKLQQAEASMHCRLVCSAECFRVFRVLRFGSVAWVDAIL